MSSIGNQSPITYQNALTSSKFWRRTMTANTVTLTDTGVILDYTQGTELVVRNGIVLTPTLHYTITNATTITLVNSAVIGDEIIVTGKQPVEFVDTYRKTEVDATFAPKVNPTFEGLIVQTNGNGLSLGDGTGARFEVIPLAGGGVSFNQLNVGERMRIDSGGRITMPYQPAFNVINGPVATGGTANIPIVFTTAVTNIGGHYSTSTYRFTAPVNGVYRFSFSLMTYQNLWSRCQFAKNGTLVGSQFYASSVSSNYIRNCGEIILVLVSGDYVTINRNTQNEASENIHVDYRHFSGELIS